jgi:hypothetical protein
VLTLLFASSEPSKVPFYVAGIVLVLWAVLLSVTGLRSESFPPSKGATRGVMAFTGLLVAITVAMAIHTSAFLHH